MEFTFQSSYIILEPVPNTVIYWTELKCWRKKLLKQGYVAPRLKSSLQKLYGRHNKFPYNPSTL